jgi:hypothetical protein
LPVLDCICARPHAMQIAKKTALHQKKPYHGKVYS